MKNKCEKILILVMAIVMLCGTAALAEREGPLRGGPVDRPGYQRMSEEKIDRMMEMLKDRDPERAGELEKLRAEDPEAFEDEIRKTARRRFGDRRRKMRESGDFDSRRGRHLSGRERGDRDSKSGFGHGRGRWGRGEDVSNDQIFEWLQANEPEKAAELAKLKEENPRLYTQKLRMIRRKYGKIIAVAEKHPELAALLRKDMKLRDVRNDVVNQIRTATDETQKQQLLKKLESVVKERFDLLIEKKRVKYEMLKAKIERLKTRIEVKEAEIKNLEDEKDENIQQRIKELTSNTEKMKWD